MVYFYFSDEHHRHSYMGDPRGKLPVEKVGVVLTASTFLLNNQKVQEMKIGLKTKLKNSACDLQI